MTERENALLAINHKEPEWVPSIFDSVYLCKDVINTRPIFNEGDDCFGVHWVCSGAESNFITNVDPKIPRKVTNLTDWKQQLELPVISSYDWEGAAAEIPEGIREQKLIYYIMGIGLFERAHTLADFEDVLCEIMLEPENMSDFFGAIADHQVELVHHIAKHMKPDVICYHDDWAMQTRPFMAIQKWEEVLKPHTQRIYDAILSYGINLVHHSCGNIEIYLPEMVKMGIQGWNSCQDSNDLAKIKAELGDKLVFWGALDDQNLVGQKGTTDEMLMAEAVKKTEMLAPGGGWLCGPNAYVSFDISQDRRIDAMIRNYSKNFYKNRKDR